MRCHAPSESEFHAKLNLAGRTQIPANTACGGNSAKIGRSDRAIRLREVGMVEDVECVRPELQVDPFGNWCGFGQGEVHVGKSRTRNDISSGISETAGVTEEGRFIEKKVGRGMIELDRLAGHQVRTIVRLQAAAAVREQGDDGTEGIPRLQVDNG